MSMDEQTTRAVLARGPARYQSVLAWSRARAAVREARRLAGAQRGVGFWLWVACAFIGALVVTAQQLVVRWLAR